MKKDEPFHGYFGVNLERVWQVIEDNLPELKKQIIAILDHLANL